MNNLAVGDQLKEGQVIKVAIASTMSRRSPSSMQGALTAEHSMLGRRLFGLIAMMALLAILQGCAYVKPVPNEPLTQWDPATGYRFRNLMPPDSANTDGLLDCGGLLRWGHAGIHAGLRSVAGKSPGSRSHGKASRSGCLTNWMSSSPCQEAPSPRDTMRSAAIRFFMTSKRVFCGRIGRAN